MSFGARLYRISRSRRTLAVSLAAALVATVFALYRPSLLPPGLHARDLEIGTASTQLLVASPDLAVGSTSYQYSAAVNQATLLGNVMVSQPILADVGRALGIPASRIQATAPMTANVPRVLIEPGSGGSATAILQSPDQYKLEIQADPAVPILHVYGQAPTASQAIRLTAAAVDGVNTYLRQLQASRKIPPRLQVQFEQLGPVHGGTANPGAPKQIALLVFVGVFGISLWLLTIVARVRRGWSSARLAGQPQS
jgi:peptidoglycan hydrolase-like protein with peptidoglycan-binding domain